LSGQWYQGSNDFLERAGGAAASGWNALAQPKRAHRLRQVILLILILWAILAVTDLVWAFLPRPDTSMPPEDSILNPLESSPENVTAVSVDVDVMMGWSLFGVAGEIPSAEEIAAEAQVLSDREGIEKGARETRLALTLRGVIAATQDGLGHAIIEHKSDQEVYAVGDKLPIGSGVTLAKVMPGEIVLDNSGTYELLRLFEDSDLMGQLPPRSARMPAAKQQPVAQAESADEGTLVLARGFRDKLYENPQSLADVVRVRAVRENEELKGYRVDPGKSSAQFTQLGFKAGDVVTSVNGIDLDDPSNTLQLYQLMRTASQAVFGLERGGELITLTVSLDEAPSGG
jgi:general secretion pathway protein C